MRLTGRRSVRTLSAAATTNHWSRTWFGCRKRWMHHELEALGARKLSLIPGTEWCGTVSLFLFFLVEVFLADEFVLQMIIIHNSHSRPEREHGRECELERELEEVLALPPLALPTSVPLSAPAAVSSLESNTDLMSNFNINITSNVVRSSQIPSTTIYTFSPRH